MAASRPSSSKPASGAQRARKQPEDIHPPPKPGQMLLHESDDERSREERHHKRFSLVKRGWGQGTVTAPVFSRDMLRPYFWKDWLALGFLWCIVTLLPYPVFMFIG